MADSAQKIGKVALVTGAGNRIGAVLARRLAAEGYAVLVHHHTSAKGAEHTAADIEKAGGNAALIQCNLSDRAQRDQLIDNAAAAFGPLSLLVNNASIFEPDSAKSLDYALWDQHFQLHAEAPMFLARDFAAQMPDQAQGNIINIIDERVMRKSPAYFSYNLSKSVLWTATQTLAQNFAPSIRVNAIAPGPTLPNARQTEAEFKADRAKLPLGTSASPNDLADAMMFILQAKSMTGQMIALDGGEHLDWRHQSTITPRLSGSSANAPSTNSEK